MRPASGSTQATPLLPPVSIGLLGTQQLREKITRTQASSPTSPSQTRWWAISKRLAVTRGSRSLGSATSGLAPTRIALELESKRSSRSCKQPDVSIRRPGADRPHP